LAGNQVKLNVGFANLSDLLRNFGAGSKYFFKSIWQTVGFLEFAVDDGFFSGMDVFWHPKTTVYIQL